MYKTPKLTNELMNALAPGHYEICNDSLKGTVRQKIRAKDQPTPGWILAQKMHTANASRIDRAEMQRANRRAARAERRAA